MTRVLAAGVPAMALALTGAASLSYAQADGAAAPQRRIVETHTGIATFYGRAFHGRITASGAPFDMHALVAAHPSLPFDTRVRVTNLHNGRIVDVRIVDRGPAKGPRATGVIIDLSRAAAERLDFIRRGRARVRLEVMASEGRDARPARGSPANEEL